MIKKFAVMMAVLLGCANLSGCFLLIPAAVGVGVGLGTAKWISDKLVEQVPQPFSKSVRAAQDGLKDLDIEILKETDTPTTTQISAKYADGRDMWIDVAVVSDTVSQIEVRVGVWGGKDDARKVLDKILAHL